MSTTAAQSLAALKAQVQRGYSLPAGFYRDCEIYALECERIFANTWIYAGHASAVAEPGDYFLYEAAGESVIVVRGANGGINAFANVCRHRGSRICTEGGGRVRTFVCPYHGWTYGLDGALRSKRHMDEGFDPGAFSLKRVNVAELEGLLFVHLGAEPATFDVAALARPLAPFELANTSVAAQRSYRFEANWKLAIENFHECYHCATAHPEYSRAHSLKAPDAESAALRGQMEQGSSGVSYAHVETDPPFGLELYYGRHPLYPGYVTGTEDGRPAAPLLGRLNGYDGGASDVSVGQLSFLLVYSDHAVIYRFAPVDVQLSEMQLTWLVHADAQPGRDYDLQRLTWLWDVTSAADKRIINNNQAGVNSRFYAPGPLSEMESYVQKFIDWYLYALS